MFCSRISSGFSAIEMKKPTNERNTRARRLHIASPFSRASALSLGLRGRLRGRGGRDRVLGHEIRHRVGNSLLLPLLLEVPGVELVLVTRHIVVVGLNAGAVLRDDSLHLLLDPAVLLALLLLEVLDCPLLHALIGVQRAVALHSVLDDLLQVHPGGIEREQNRAPLHPRRKVANVLVLKHLGDLEDGVPVRRWMDLGHLVELLEGGGVARRSTERWRLSKGGCDLGDGACGAPVGCRWVLRGRLPYARFPRRLDRDEEVVPLLRHVYLPRPPMMRILAQVARR